MLAPVMEELRTNNVRRTDYSEGKKYCFSAGLTLNQWVPGSSPGGCTKTQFLLTRAGFS